MAKNTLANAGFEGFIPGLGRSPGGGNGNSFLWVLLSCALPLHFLDNQLRWKLDAAFRKNTLRMSDCRENKGGRYGKEVKRDFTTVRIGTQATPCVE